MLPYLFPRQLSQWLGPVIAAGIAALLVAAIVVTTGVVDQSAAKPHPQG